MYTLVDENMWQLLLAFDPSMLAECLKFNHSYIFMHIYICIDIYVLLVKRCDRSSVNMLIL